MRFTREASDFLLSDTMAAQNLRDLHLLLELRGLNFTYRCAALPLSNAVRLCLTDLLPINLCGYAA